MIRLETERLVIRDHVLEDLIPMHTLVSDADTMKFMPDIKTDTLEQTRQNLETAIRESVRGEDRGKYFFAVTDKNGIYIGDIGYTVYSRDPDGGKNGHLGYFILKKYWGKGITSEAVRAVLRFAFTEGGILKMETGCARGNTASEAVMVKCGFIKEADKIRHEWIGGSWRDRVEYRMLKEEWDASNL